MVFCLHCQRHVAGMRPDDDSLHCNLCGKVLEDHNFSQEPTFVKNAAGQSQMAGHYVKTIQSDHSTSRDRTMYNAKKEILYLSNNLGMDDGNLINQALKFYEIAIERNFTKGRRSEQVQAACLYVAFRENDKPFLLIDFSNHLRTNVYILGAVFLQLCKVLRLEEHPIVQKPVDPSLFIYKYTNNLLKQGNMDVTETALRIVASMKRDWMQTGRKPSGLCGAALYISALAHGFKCSKSDILRIVHVCEATLTKRLVEFENTESGSLTIDELNAMAKEREKSPTEKPNTGLKESNPKDLLCKHKGCDVPYYAIGLCEECYKDFVKLSGGLDGGLDPPAFQRAERERMEKSLAKEDANESSDLANELSGACPSKNEAMHSQGPESIEDNVEHVAAEDCGYDKLHSDDGMSNKAHDESESLSDIDDHEVIGYLHNEQEKHYKKIIWEEMNREYLEEQAAKEAAALAAKEAFEASFKNCSGDLQAAKQLAAAAAAAVAKSKKERQEKRSQEAKNSTPAQTAAEATRQILIKKRLSSKVNYDVLDKLFEEPASPENPKKIRTDSHNEKGHASKEKNKFDEQVPEDEFADEGDGGDAEMYENAMFDENMDETYDYDDYDDYGNSGCDRF